MVHSLRFRLIASFALVILVTISAVLFMINRATQDEIRRFGERVDQMRADRMEFSLSVYYLQRGGWEGIQPLVAQAGSIYGQRIILTDSAGMVVADSDGVLLDERYKPDATGRPLSPSWHTGSIGTLYFSPRSSPCCRASRISWTMEINVLMIVIAATCCLL